MDHSQNKGLSEYQRRASQYGLAHHPAGGREEGKQQPELEGKGQSGPRDSIFHQNVSRLPVANHIFLGSWMVDICQEGHSPRSAPQRKHTAHLRWCSRGAPRKPSSQDWGGDKMHHTPGTVCSPSTWSPKLLRPGKGTKCMPNQVCAFVEYSRT